MSHEWTRGLSVRALNALDKCGITTLDELLAWPREALLRSPGLGRKTLKEIEEFIGERSLCLATEEDFVKLSPGDIADCERDSGLILDRFSRATSNTMANLIQQSLGSVVLDLVKRNRTLEREVLTLRSQLLAQSSSPGVES